MKSIDTELIRVFGVVSEDDEIIRKTIDSLVSLSDMARKEGLLALEEAIPSLSPVYLKLGLQLVVDGTDPNTIRRVLYLARHAGDLNEREIALRMIIEDGVLGIQEGLNPRVLKTHLMAYLGEGAAMQAAME